MKVKRSYLIYAILGCIFAANIIFSCTKYIEYRRGQDTTMYIMSKSYEYAGDDRFSHYSDNRSEMVDAMYNVLTNYSAYGYNISSINKTFDKALKKQGYDESAVYYLRYNGFIPYIMGELFVYWIIFAAFCTIVITTKNEFAKEKKG